MHGNASAHALLGHTKEAQLRNRKSAACRATGAVIELRSASAGDIQLAAALCGTVLFVDEAGRASGERLLRRGKRSPGTRRLQRINKFAPDD